MVDINNDWLHEELFIPTSSNRLEYNFIFSGFYGMVEMWLQNGCKESDEQLINILKKFYCSKPLDIQHNVFNCRDTVLESC